MYLLNHQTFPRLLVLRLHLHSTMYLLNPDRAGGDKEIQQNDLHSTMYLLNPKQAVGLIAIQNNLHSTMYLLNR